MLRNKSGLKLATICVLFILQMLITSSVLAGQSNNAAAKYVFLFIGDGMGHNQVQAAEKFYGKLNFMDFAQHGQMTTSEANGKVTDSAAAATAMASGSKTHNGFVGLDPQGNRLESIASLIKKQGLKVGIVSSMQLDDATPAAFYAHRLSRRMRYEIATDLAVSNFDYFAGGGLRQPTGKNGDQTNIWDLLRANGYQLVTGNSEFRQLKKSDNKVFVRSEGLYEDLSLSFVIDQKPSISLAELTAKGIKLLDNKQGFFMLVEGGKIDYAGHTNDLATNIKEVGDFEQAVQVALNFYEQHPRDTLIIVTADHETGGMQWLNPTLAQEDFIAIVNGQTLSYQEFGKIVQEYVRSGKRGELSAWQDTLREKFGLDNLSEQEYEYLQQAVYASMRQEKYGPYEPLMIAACRVLGQRAGVSWSTYGHSGVNIPVYAIGAGSTAFAGNYDNTQLAPKILRAMGIR